MMHEWKRTVLEKRYSVLKKQIELLNDKRALLEDEKILQNQPEELFRIKRRLKGISNDIREIEEEIYEIQDQLFPSTMNGKYCHESRALSLSPSLHRRIADFLMSLPNINERTTQQAFIHSANLDIQLQGLIVLGCPSVQFIQILLETLVRYGQLENGQNAVEAVLEAAKLFIGSNRREFCDTLIDELRQYVLDT